MAKKVTGRKAVTGSIAEEQPGTDPVVETRESVESLAEQEVVTRTGQIEKIGGEFRGDFTRDTFDPPKHYSRVLMQQGRVQLDADWNEQADIILHYLRAMARDIIGPHGGPDGDGFKISIDKKTLAIGKGHYYVDGILCENETATLYSRQPDYPLSKEQKTEWEDLMKENTSFLVYLDVWERHITMIQDRKIREIALNGPDTATRSQVVWQVRLLQDETLQEIIAKFSSSERNPCPSICEYIRGHWSDFNPRKGMTPQLKVMAKEPEDSSSVCIIRPDSRYRGPENQLYRVEIHKPGTACTPNDKNCATFKWSRDNSSIDFPINSLEGTTATLEYLGRDDQSTLTEGDWVEILDDKNVLRQECGDLVQLESVDRVGLTVTFASAPSSISQKHHPLVRRWDHREDLVKGRKLRNGAIPVEEGTSEDDWIELEDGVQIQFQPKGHYYTGNYWLIPARTISGNVGWPWDETGEQPRPPHGIAHHYAPLAVVYYNKKWNPCDCRCMIERPCVSKTQRG